MGLICLGQTNRWILDFFVICTHMQTFLLHYPTLKFSKFQFIDSIHQHKNSKLIPLHGRNALLLPSSSPLSISNQLSFLSFLLPLSKNQSERSNEISCVQTRGRRSGNNAEWLPSFIFRPGFSTVRGRWRSREARERRRRGRKAERRRRQKRRHLRPAAAAAAAAKQPVPPRSVFLP